MAEGTFDDTAVIRRVVGEALVLAGGGRALLLQVANPGVAQGVRDHSDFASRPLDRLHATMTYIYAVVFGTRKEAAAAARIVTTTHRAVTGPGYSASDPALQVWVAATLFETSAGLFQRCFGPLSEDALAELYQQYQTLATRIGTPTDAWPASPTQFRSYWDHMIQSLDVGDTARAISRQILYPDGIPVLLRPLLPVHRLVTVGLLPEPVRSRFGLDWDESQERRLQRILRATATIYPRLPVPVRHLPKICYLARMRRSHPTPSGSAAGARDQTRR